MRKGIVRGMKPVMQSGQQKPQGGTAGQNRQRCTLARGKWSVVLVPVYKGSRIIREEAAGLIEAPGIDADGNVPG